MNKIKNFILLEKGKLKYKNKSSNHNHALFALYYFLADRINTEKSAKEFIKLLTEKEEFSEGEYIEIYKKGELVSIMLFYWQDIIVEEDNFETTKEKLIKIINQWKETTKKEPNEILIYEDHKGKINIKGYNKAPKECSEQQEEFARFYILKVTIINSDKEDFIKISHKIESCIQKLVSKTFGSIIDGAPYESHTIYGLRRQKSKTVKDLIKLFPNLTWNLETDNPSEGPDKVLAKWKKSNPGETFFDEKVESVEIYTQA